MRRPSTSVIIVYDGLGKDKKTTSAENPSSKEGIFIREQIRSKRTLEGSKAIKKFK